jgi:tetratricopeptide (TPR) repeat protein
MPARTQSRQQRRRARTTKPPATISSLQKNLLICGLLGVFTVLLYSPARGFSFVNYDDDSYITENAHVQAGLTLDTIRWAITSTEHDNWHPLTWLSHALDCDLYGVRPGAHHITNVLIHALNVVLVFLLLWKATGSRGRSLLVAILFAVHPVNVESVVWISERKNVLSTLLMLLTIAAYGRYARKPNAKCYAAVAAFFALALMAKPMVVTLPFGLLLLDFWPLNRVQGWTEPATTEEEPAPQSSFLRLFLEKLPLLALSAGDSFLTMLAQRKGGAIHLILPFGVRLENAVYAYAQYICEALWPTKLAVFYPHPGRSLTPLQVALAVLLLIAVSALVWRERARRYLVIGWLWYLGTLVPVIGLVQVGDQAMADRYAYIPLLGIFLMVVFGLADLADVRHVPLRFRAAASAVVLVILVVLSWRQVGYWRSNLALWSHTVGVTKDNVYAEVNLGATLLQHGRPDLALPHFQNAARINPRDPGTHLNMGATYASVGRNREAIDEYKTAIPSITDRKILAQAYLALGAIYVRLGDYPAARENYRRSLEYDPTLPGPQQALKALGGS